MKFRPLHDRVVVRRVDEEERSAGGIIIPDTAKEKPQMGKIVAAGPGKTTAPGEAATPDVAAAPGEAATPDVAAAPGKTVAAETTEIFRKGDRAVGENF